jgi:hypothetical protein
VFKTAKELYDFRITIQDLCNKGKFQAAEQMLSHEPVIEINNLHELDGEGYQFARSLTLWRIAQKKWESEHLDKEKKKTHASQSLDAASHYLTNYKNFEPQDTTAKDKMLIHQCTMYQLRGQAYSQLGRLTMPLVDDEERNEEAKEFVLSSINDLEEAYKLSRKRSEISNNVNPLDILDLLVSEYCLMSNLSNQDLAECFLDKVRTIQRVFRDNSKNNSKAQEYFNRVTQVLEPYELRQKQKQLANTKLTSKKGKAFLNKKINELEVEKLKALKVANQGFTGVRQPHQYLRALALNNIENPDVVQKLLELEQQIKSQIQGVNPSPTLEDVYKQYAHFIGEDTLIDDTMKFILPSLIAQGNVKEALDRIVAIANLEYKPQGHRSDLIRVLLAGIKSLNGDFSDWLKIEEIEEEIKTQHTQFKEKKKRKKKPDPEVIRKKLQNQQDVKEEQHPPSVQTHLRPVMPKAQTEDDTPFSSLKEEKERKEKRQLRHEEAEKKRREDTMSQTATLNPTVEHPPAPQPAPAQPLPKIRLPKISELYDLKGVAERVDTELEGGIEAGTFKVSREEMIIYFESLGCKAKNGAKHKKISLPPALLIEYQGQMLTIINDLGGALTLPRWDSAHGNGTVPKYLRQQILTARDKLILLKMKENETRAAVSTSNT